METINSRSLGLRESSNGVTEASTLDADVELEQVATDTSIIDIIPDTEISLDDLENL